METPHPGVPPRPMLTTTMLVELVPGDTVMPLALFKRLRLDPVLDQQLDPVLDQPLDPALGPSAPPHPGVPPRLMPTTTMLVELVPGDTVMPLALFKRPLPPQHLPLLPQLLLDLLSLLPQ